ncbi:ABC transporter, permease protein [hydrothermal vent metagenome]|uniref:ABC transporter, permease protein n=1 Tax=hydrothermal vent metagenome TaxID=652676 RepID=A0A3B1DX85_9ZZZZ
MPNKEFIKFSFVLFLKEKSDYMVSIFIFTFIIFILSSVLFISNSISFDLKQTINYQPQILVQNQKAGNTVEIDDSILDELLQITGVSDITGRVDGYYYFLQNDSYFHIIGDNDCDEKIMTVGDGVKLILNKYYYTKYFNFFVNGKSIKIDINNTISLSANIVSNDLIILNTEIARKIFGLEEDEYSYLLISVPNDSEINYIAQKIKEIYPYFKITTKKQLKSDIDNLFYYKGGVFMVLYTVVFYRQIDSTSGAYKKEIAILRSLGFSINNIIFLKFIQNCFVVLFSYILGIVLAYYFVFFANAPLLKYIFLGNNLTNNMSFTPILHFDILFMIFLFTAVPYILSILLPSWRIAISDMNEAMK